MLILCVDDEAADLGLSIDLCRQLPQKPETVGFQGGREALSWLRTHPADLALLNIHMPDMDGLTLARRIREQSPDTGILFLTAHAERAVEAFQLHPSGYILKPLTPERLAAEVDYALSRKRRRAASHVTVQTFGEFEIAVDGIPISFRRNKAKELLALLVDRQGRRVSRRVIFETLWENEIYDRAKQKYLDVVIRSLRKTLEEYGVGEILEMDRGSLRVRPETMDCDLYRLMRGDAAMVQSFPGEYMSSYSWASLTEGYLERINRER